ncbi:hypothetical protein MRX96_057804 [Rhipicephalus microplus]
MGRLRPPAATSRLDTSAGARARSPTAPRCSHGRPGGPVGAVDQALPPAASRPDTSAGTRARSPTAPRVLKHRMP